MICISGNRILTLLPILVVILSCQFNQEQPTLTEQETAEAKTNTQVDHQKREIIDFVEALLFAAGNKNVAAMKEMIFEEAIVGNTYLKDSLWLTQQWSVNELYEIYQKEGSKPYLEIVDDYEMIITDRMALVKADAVINRFGVPGKREVNHITLIRSDGQWKLYSIAWSVHEQAEEILKFNINLFAQGYAQVWGSQRPEFVAMFFEEDGVLRVNDNEPAMGRDAISNLAQSFMTQFPDMNVSFDSLAFKENGIEFHWTLTGTDADPNGKGHKVRISGFELWTMSEENLIKKSEGSFSVDEYNRQLEFGINN